MLINVMKAGWLHYSGEMYKSCIRESIIYTNTKQ